MKITEDGHSCPSLKHDEHSEYKGGSGNPLSCGEYVHGFNPIEFDGVKRQTLTGILEQNSVVRNFRTTVKDPLTVLFPLDAMDKMLKETLEECGV
jgi:hypothetical protein